MTGLGHIRTFQPYALGLRERNHPRGYGLSHELFA
jgi:hypothetical protein